MGGRRQVTVVIPVRNRAEGLAFTLDSIFQQEYPFFTIVVDYGSHDDVEGAVAPYKDRLRLMRLKGIPEDHDNPAKALNAGVKAAKTPFILLHGTDTTHRSPKNFQWLAEPVIKDPKYWTMATLDNWAGNRLKAHWTSYKRPNGGWFVSCLSKAAFDAVGGFNERFTHYGYEDHDLLDRLTLAGLVHVVVPCVRADHFEHGRPKNLNDEKRAMKAIYLEEVGKRKGFVYGMPLPPQP